MKFFSWKFSNSQNHSTRKVRLQITKSRFFPHLLMHLTIEATTTHFEQLSLVPGAKTINEVLRAINESL